MNRKVTFFRLLLLTMAVFTLFPSCSRQKKATKTATEIRFGFTTEPATLDPLSAQNTADGRSILFNVFEGLVKPDTDGMMRPCIAESWVIEQNGSVYTFHLREGVRFHDGSFVTAQDVKFSLDAAVEAKFTGMDRISDVTIINGNRVRVTLVNPDLEFLPYMTVGIVKANNTDREKNVIGTGPFIVESYKTQQNLVLKKFEDYWQRDKPHLDKVTIVFLANYDALMVALRGGSIDGARLTGAMSALLDHRQFDIIHNYSASVQLLALNNNVPPLNDIRVRRALNYGIDIKDIIDTAFFGAGVPSGNPIIPGLAVYYAGSLTYPYEPETARKLLAEAGFNDSNKISLEITVPSNYTMHVDTAQVIVNHLEKIGVNASIKLVDWTTWVNDTYRGRQYMATIISLDSPIVSPRSFLSRYQSAAGDNFINFSNQNFDRIYNSILSETNQTSRVNLYKDAQRVIVDNAASVYIQDIFYFQALKGGVYAGVLNYPLYVTDFASIYGVEKN
jgi:peptide/nickel transport system substrate-binding protein